MDRTQSVIRFPKAGFSLCALVIALGAATPASAQWLSASGNVTTTTSSFGSNFAFRVGISQNGVDQLSTCTYSFAYINTDDSNYQAKVASLLTAASQGRPVQISYSKDSAGWCSFGDVTIIF